VLHNKAVYALVPFSEGLLH